ncbi:hypothetical protein NDI56_07395 [Haloarcula sp. S1CR25-12]|uniref:DUF7527 domain-containing protein n=1 Tax=Haloarcula saliterrae TaxID=2950534 RepID=A0ABU2FAB0_9EURY|nr:hypothetical protein [Haloarcula sp. S1CR25-12]MDS0259215.1 hypothetical protein [Haloarcula sp. S1CR25-12]
MSTRTVELVSEWDTVPFGGGYEGLHTLSDQGFSGAVTAGPTQLFMLNGTVVGILDGDIEAFEDAAGTARAAPHDALPLLVVMQDRADTPRAQYYTQDTPISEVDRTLEDGNFTGFVELSENVLSGDYYLVYHQGRSMSVAWVGSSQRLITDEDAFEQADDEVGIYQVMPAAIEPVELPELPEPDDEPVATAATEQDESSGGVDDDEEPSTTSEEPQSTAVSEPSPTTDDGAAGGSGRSEPTDRTDADDADATPSATADTGAAGPPGSKAAGASHGSAVEEQQREEPRDSAEPEESGTAEPRRDSETARAESEPATREPADPEPEPTPSEAETAQPSEPRSAPVDPTARESDETDESEPVPSGETGTAATAADSDAAGALETRSIPSLDPDRSSSTPDEPVTQTTVTEPKSAPSSTASTTTPSPPEQSQQASARTTEPEPTDSERDAAPTAELEARVEERESEIAALESEIDALSTENEELAAERDQLLTDLEEARAEIQRLEDELEAAGGTATGGLQLSAAEAIDGTNLFVRYHSKGEATLAKAQDGSANRAAVDENLRLEYHTQFDGDEAVVDGEAFEAFLRDSIQYRFVDWLVGDLLYEIRDTGHESAMDVLYDALPDIDRAELNGKVSVTYTEDGQEHRSQETFDVVVRDRMGNPLVVANINDSRQPATDGQMTDIVRNAERVGNASDSLSGAFLVTSSFFEPEALETAKEATSSGLFSRDKRKSFVNLSRKGGYHLCLLEARNKEFHLAVPEL